MNKERLVYVSSLVLLCVGSALMCAACVYMGVTFMVKVQHGLEGIP